MFGEKPAVISAISAVAESHFAYTRRQHMFKYETSDLQSEIAAEVRAAPAKMRAAGRKAGCRY